MKLLKSAVLSVTVLFAVNVFSENMSPVIGGDVSCNSSDCLKFGSVMTENTIRIETTCNSSDCAHFGWVENTNYNATFYSSCKPGGCYVGGYETIDQDGLPVEDVTCKYNDCLKNGMWIKTSEPLQDEVTCIAGNCAANGWIYRYGRQTYVAQCKARGCYIDGWTY